jgi:hypothetical protein
MPRLSDEQRFQWTIDTFEEVFMTPWRYMVSGLFALAVFWSAAIALPVSAAAQEGQNSRGKKVEVHLTESFYRALGEQGAKTYTNSVSDDYLRQIAVSTRFMVETNLRIIEQQARIIELLEKAQTE